MVCLLCGVLIAIRHCDYIFFRTLANGLCLSPMGFILPIVIGFLYMDEVKFEEISYFWRINAPEECLIQNKSVTLYCQWRRNTVD